MAEIVRMPKLSDTMTEGVVAEWHKQVGDTVAEGDLLAEIETDKATMEFESFYDGVLLHIGVEKGGTAPVNNVLAVIGEKGEDFAALLEESEAAPAEAEEEASEAAAVETAAVEVEAKSETVVATPPVEVQTPVSNGSSNGRIFASPLARKMAEDKGIDLSTIVGSGENNRIVKRDVENYQPAASTAEAASAVDNSSKYISAGVVGKESYTDVPNSQMRKAIARTLAESKFSAPHFYLKMEVDMDNAIAARKAINAEEGIKISFNDMIVKAVATALRRHPKVNADWLGESIRYNDHIHLGVAVAVDEGLVVPVVRFADTKGFVQLGAEIKDLAVRAREKKLAMEEMEGGTFAISNLGMYGIEDFTSIINPPNGCILSVGQIKATPVVKNGEIVPGNVMKLSLSCDHRVVDGAIGSEFLQTLKQLLEDPVRMLA